jgi:hypothetical protein
VNDLARDVLIPLACVYLGIRAIVDFVLFTIIGEEHILPFIEFVKGWWKNPWQ